MKNKHLWGFAVAFIINGFIFRYIIVTHVGWWLEFALVFSLAYISFALIEYKLIPKIGEMKK